MPSENSSNIASEAVNKVAVKLFLAICKKWQLTDSQKCILAGISQQNTLSDWESGVDNKANIALSEDSLIRLSYIAGIYKCIQLLHSDPVEWKEWIKKPNRGFAGKSALEYMLRGRITDLADVRYYLEEYL